ncbi:hypothetical protein QA802_01505 [Streptomyces sp. B21-105]
MSSFDRTGRALPLLTSRRHIDFGRTSSAFCRPVRHHSSCTSRHQR